MRRPVSRRALLDASAAIGGALALPATLTVPAAAADAAAAPGPDAELFGLLSQLAEARDAHAVTCRAMDEAETDTPAYDAAGQRCDEACDVLIGLEMRVHDTPARTLAGLVAKAAVQLQIVERDELDEVAVAFLREVAAFQVPT